MSNQQIEELDASIITRTFVSTFFFFEDDGRETFRNDSQEDEGEGKNDEEERCECSRDEEGD